MSCLVGHEPSRTSLFITNCAPPGLEWVNLDALAGWPDEVATLGVDVDLRYPTAADACQGD